MFFVSKASTTLLKEMALCLLPLMDLKIFIRLALLTTPLLVQVNWNHTLSGFPGLIFVGLHAI